MFDQFRVWLTEPLAILVNERLDQMTSREQTAYDNLNATIQSVRDGWSSLVAERDSYKSALEQADANQAQAVQDALAADSEHDADAIEAADASLASLVTPVQPDPAAEGTEGDVPAETPVDTSGDQPA